MRYVFIVLCLTACAAERQPGELFGSVEEGSALVVDGILLVDQPLPELFVRRIQPPGQTYSRDAAGVPDAQVRVFQGDQVFEYAPDPAAPGRYLPPPAAPVVQTTTEYRLEVDVEGKAVRASTTTPERVRVRQAVLLDEDTQEITRTLKSFAEVGDEVYTAPENQLTHLEGLIEFHLEKAGEAYQAAIFALEENAQLLDEDFPDIYDESPEDLRANQSPPLAASDGIMRWPWFAVVYTGRSLDKGVRTRPQLVRVRPLQPRPAGTGRLWGDGRRQFRATVLSGRGRHRAVCVGVSGFGGICHPAATMTFDRLKFTPRPAASGPLGPGPSERGRRGFR